MMGEDVPLFTFQLPKVQYQLEKSIPLLRIVCFEVGLKMGFEMNAKLAFGFDTYGFKLYGDSGDALDVAQGAICFLNATRRWEPGQFRSNLAYLQQFFELWPEHLLAELDSRGPRSA